MLWHWDIFIFEVGLEVLVDLYYLLKVKFFEVDIHPPDEEVNEVALFELITSDGSEPFEYLRDVPIEVIKALNIFELIAIFFQELHIVGGWE